MAKLIDQCCRYWRSRMAREVAQDLLPIAHFIMDIGCEDNYFLKKLLRLPQAPSLVGIDPAAVHHHPRIKNIMGCFPQDLPETEQKNQYDLIFALAVWEYIAENSLPDVMATLAKMLAPQGRLIITTASPAANYLVNFLTMLHLMNASCTTPRHHLNLPQLIKCLAPYFQLEKHHRFALGLNHLLVLRPRLSK